MLNLLNLPSWYLTKYGAERVAEIAGVSGSVLDFWIQRNEFPLAALQKLLELDPEPLAAVKPLYENPASGTKLAILLPTNRKPEPDTIESLFKLYDSRTMVFKRMGYNMLYHVRNMMAAWYLDSGIEQSFWSDDDSVHPCGDARWFKEVSGLLDMPDSYAGVHTINRLLAQNKKIIGSSYVSRKINSAPQFAGGNSLEMMEQQRQGPRNQVLKRDWVGFGGILVHRDVFLDIIKTQGPEIRVKNEAVRTHLRYEYDFFRPTDTEANDDIAFCARARKAGHDVFVDLAIAAGHVGTRVYTYRDIRKK